MYTRAITGPQPYNGYHINYNAHSAMIVDQKTFRAHLCLFCAEVFTSCCVHGKREKEGLICCLMPIQGKLFWVILLALVSIFIIWLGCFTVFPTIEYKSGVRHGTTDPVLFIIPRALYRKGASPLFCKIYIMKKCLPIL